MTDTDCYGADRLPFRIKGEINKVAVRRGLFAKKAALEQANQYQVICHTSQTDTPKAEVSVVGSISNRRGSEPRPVLRQAERKSRGNLVGIGGACCGVAAHVQRRPRLTLKAGPRAGCKAGLWGKQWLLP
jgi:hypothetical protein